MRKILFFLIYFFLFTLNANAKHDLPEKYYQEQWCTKYNGIMEYTLADDTRVDCLTKNYAVEFDFAPKWAESIGQSLYYASKTGKIPGIVLIIENKKDYKYYNKIKNLCNKYGITLWYMEKPSSIPEYSENSIILENIIKFILKLLDEIFKLFK